MILTKSFDEVFVRAEVLRLGDEREVLEIIAPAAYVQGLDRTIGWLLGTHSAPLSGFGGVISGEVFDTEWRTAMLMVEDPERGFDGHDPKFVLAVYRALAWFRTATDADRATLADPLFFS